MWYEGVQTVEQEWNKQTPTLIRRGEIRGGFLWISYLQFAAQYKSKSN